MTGNIKQIPPVLDTVADIDVSDVPDVDLFDIYFELIEESSECPLLYHRWTLISAVAALLGRHAYMNFGFDTIYPNMFICLMGSSGTRKSSSIKIGKSLIEATGYTKFARERSSKEKFIKDLSVGFDVINGAMDVEDDSDVMELNVIPFADLPPAEVYITAGELEDFLGSGDAQFISLLTNMWDNLPRYGHGKLSSKDIWIKEPTVNLMGGCTSVTFNTVFPPEIIGQGLLARMLLIHGGGVRKKITIPKHPDAALLKFFEEHMCQIQQQMVGEFTFTKGSDEGLGEPTAYTVFDDVYQGNINLNDVRLESYLNRRHVHLYKLCIVIAATKLTKVITHKIAKEANTILHYTECLMPKALGEFGKSFKADKAAIVMRALEDTYTVTKKGVGLEDLFKMVSTNFDSYSKDYGEVIGKLKIAGKIKIVSAKLVPVTDSTIKQIPHVDFEMLREHREDKLKNK